MPDALSTTSSYPPLTPDTEDRRKSSTNSPAAWRRMLSESVATLGLVIALFTGIGTVIGVMGFKLWGPPQEVAQIRLEVRQRDSTLTVRVVKLEDGAGRQLDDLRAVKEDVRSLFFLQCEGMRRTERGAPSVCFPILQARGTR